MESIILRQSSNSKVEEYDRHSNAAVENATEENNGQWNFGTSSGGGDDDVRGASAKALSVKGLTAQQDFTASSSKDSGVVVTASSSDDRKSQHSTK